MIKPVLFQLSWCRRSQAHNLIRIDLNHITVGRMDKDQLDGERDKLDQVKRCDGCGEQDHDTPVVPRMALVIVLLVPFVAVRLPPDRVTVLSLSELFHVAVCAQFVNPDGAAKENEDAPKFTVAASPLI